ncbi:hypothetical protein Tsubulata_032915 [Turnera subulata]|uniref:F-box domain-containing protein n=1 Tax=Turnera subulata TaxID=218843 RepID=A0A9Q0J6Q0_9ROSI|nr:hypothetical protein Tsubulata_032915 [Turnera subulata]
MSSSRSSKTQRRDEGSDETAAIGKKHNKTRAPKNRLLVGQAKSTNTEQLVISTNMAAPNCSNLPPDVVEAILDLLPIKSIEQFRSVSKSLFSLVPHPFIQDVSGHYGKWETIVWNPRKLPLGNNYAYAFGRGFVHDSASDDYKVFAVTDLIHRKRDCELVETISLETGFWKKVKILTGSTCNILNGYWAWGSLLEWSTSLETPGIISGRKG